VAGVYCRKRLIISKTLNKLIPHGSTVRQAHDYHERNQLPTVRPEPVEGVVG
jgi:hypothetical protein